jgi:hypothetical protein
VRRKIIKPFQTPGPLQGLQAKGRRRRSHVRSARLRQDHAGSRSRQ